MLSYKNTFPFRIGTTSYVFPADILPNVEKLAPLVDDIELVLFESGSDTNLPGPALVQELRALAQANSLTYTVHFPIDLKAGSSDQSERTKYAGKVHSILERTRGLDPYAYVMHFEGIENYASTGRIIEWQTNVRDTLDQMRKSGISFDCICIENLGYPWVWHKEIVAEYGFLNCCDVGHLWLAQNPDWAMDAVALRPHTRVVHLHGTHQGKDHISLEMESSERVEQFARDFLKEYRHVVTIETFSEHDTFSSLEVLKKTWDRLHL